MNCINKQQIFDFINNELSAEEAILADQHIKDCPVCKELYVQTNEEINIIKNGVEAIEIPEIQIPAFNFPNQKTQVKTKRLVPLILRVSIAASLLILLSVSLFILNQKKQENLDFQIWQIEQELMITDMNEAWHDREIIITEMDIKTGKSELFLTTEPNK